MGDEIPQWAVKRRCALVDAVLASTQTLTIAEAESVAFARYIAEHEEDPLLIEAREVAVSTSYGGDQNWAMDWRERTLSGRHDGEDRVQVALAALKRGIELAKSDG